MIKRDFYLNQVIRHMHNGEIKVITGIHQCGKSLLLFELFRGYLLEQGGSEAYMDRLNREYAKSLAEEGILCK